MQTPSFRRNQQTQPSNALNSEGAKMERNSDKDYSWLAELSLAAQARLVREWDGSRAKLEVFMDIIAGLSAGDDQFAVRVLCEGLIANAHLQPYHRARIEIWMSFLKGEDAGERIDAAEYWLADARRIWERSGLMQPDEFISLRARIERLRAGLVPVEEDAPTEEARQRPVDILKFTPASQLTPEQIGPGMSIKDKIKMIDDHARMDREEEALEAAIASSSETAFPGDVKKTSEQVAATSTEEPAGFVAPEAVEDAKAAVDERQADTETEGATEGVATGEEAATTGQDVPMDDLVAPTASQEDLTTPAQTTDKSSKDDKNRTLRRMHLRTLPSRTRMLEANAAYQAHGVVKRKKTRQDLRNLFDVGGDGGQAGASTQGGEDDGRQRSL